MEKIVDVTGGKGGSAFLILGTEKTALFDCGMAYCARQLIDNIERVLDKRTLDYILISHSHYDHIGAIPYIKKRWINAQVLGADYAKQILTRTNALNTIRSFGIQAAKFYHNGTIDNYDDAMMKVDCSIGDGDILDLGGLTVKVIATPGHTKCSLSFLVDQTIFLSESTGFLSKSGKFYACFITSCAEAINSINRCQEINPQFIISPHYGLVSANDTPDYWKNCMLAIKASQEFILRLAEQGYSNEQILSEYEKEFQDEQSMVEQPIYAFRLNVENMIKTVLREAQRE